MRPVGSRLKDAREAQGLSIHDIAAVTKISIAALEALERDDYTRLPGGIFGRSFVKAYAIQVGLDPNEIVASFAAELAAAEREAATRKVIPAVSADDRAFLERQRRALQALRYGGSALAVALLLLLVWLGVHWWNGRTAPPPAPEAMTTPAEPRPLTPPPPADPTPPVTPQPAGLSVAFTVSGDCWVRIAADGLVILERLMRSGEKHAFTAEHEVTLDVGNAGVFTWTLNGRSARSLGGPGSHRIVQINRENVESFWQP